MAERELDIRRIEPLFLKENWLVGLGFPQGYIFFRALRKETFVYVYNELSSLAAGTYSTEAQYGIAARNIENAFRIPTSVDHIYQIFRGMCPSALRTYLGVPYTSTQHNLDAAARLASSPFGFVSGFESPYNDPSPQTEVWVPHKLDVGFAEYNPLSDTIEPLIKFILNRYEVSLIRNVDLVMNILSGRQECRLATIGGLTDFSYPYGENYHVLPVKLTDERAEVEQKLRKGG